jgi:hypothetical protein
MRVWEQKREIYDVVGVVRKQVRETEEEKQKQSLENNHIFRDFIPLFLSPTTISTGASSIY